MMMLKQQRKLFLLFVGKLAKLGCKILRDGLEIFANYSVCLGPQDLEVGRILN